MNSLGHRVTGETPWTSLTRPGHNGIVKSQFREIVIWPAGVVIWPVRFGPVTENYIDFSSNECIGLCKMISTFRITIPDRPEIPILWAFFELPSKICHFWPNRENFRGAMLKEQRRSAHRDKLTFIWDHELPIHITESEIRRCSNFGGVGGI